MTLRAGLLQTGLFNQSTSEYIGGSARFVKDNNTAISTITRGGQDGDRRRWTFSAWIKRGKINEYQLPLIGGSNGTGHGFIVRFSPASAGVDTLQIADYISGYNLQLITNRVFRDTEWYHIVIAVDTSQTTDSDRVKLYVNGTQETSFGTATYPSQNYETFFNTQVLGGQTWQGSINGYYDGQISQVYFIDGRQLDSSYFGFTEGLTNTWRPKKYLGDLLTDDVTTEAFAIESSEQTSDGQVAANAFNGNTANEFAARWRNNSSNDGSVANNEYIGQDFGSGNEQDIRRFRILQGRTSGTGEMVTQVKLQHSDNNTTWTDAGTYTLDDIFAYQQFDVTPSGSHRYWRVLCTATLNTVWLITELEMYAYSSSYDNYYGTNGFHLPLDGNSPIGEDKSGVVRNNDGKVWSSGLKSTVQYGNPVTNMFDGDEATSATVYGKNLASSNALVQVLTYQTFTIKKTFEIRQNNNSGFPWTVKINGTDYTSEDPPGGTEWIKVNGIPANTIASGATLIGPLGTGGGVFGIRIDGEVLIDGQKGNSLRGCNIGTVALDKATGALPILKTDGSGHNVRPGTFGEHQNHTVTVSSKTGGGNAYYINGTERPALGPLCRGSKITFDTSDSSVNTHPIQLSALNDGKHASTAYSVFFDGTNDYLESASSTDYAFGTGDFTYEAWIFVHTFSNTTTYESPIIEFNDNKANFNIKSGGTILSFWDGSTDHSSNSAAWHKNEWTHVALVKRGESFSFYSNGMYWGGGTTSMDCGSSARQFKSGSNFAGNANYLGGFISDLRVVKGTAVYGANFDPPTTSLTNITNTVLLCCQNSSAGTATVGTITASGAAASQNIHPLIYGNRDHNDGTVWSSGTVGGSPYNSNHTWAEAFNGDIFNNMGASGSGTTANQYNLALPSITFNTITIYSQNNNTNGIFINGSHINSDNTNLIGQGLDSQNLAKRTYTSDELGTNVITSIGTNGQNRWFGLEIDGVLLVDGRNASGTDTTSFVIPRTAPDTLYYYCQNHSGMGNSISVITDENKSDSLATKCTLALPMAGGEITDDYRGVINGGYLHKMPISSPADVSFNYSHSNFYNGSSYFDGTNDRLVTRKGPAYVKEPRWTLEFWIKLVSLPGNNASAMIFDSGSGSGNTELSVFNNGGTIQLYESHSSGTDWDSVSMVVDQWYHVAQTVEGIGKDDATALNKIYLNGQLVVSNTVDLNGRQGNRESFIGTRTDQSLDANMYLQDFRFYEGVKYTSNFIPASTNPDILPDTPSGVSGSSKLTKITDGAVAFDGTSDTVRISSSSFPQGSSSRTLEFFVWFDGTYASWSNLCTYGTASSTAVFGVNIGNNGTNKNWNFTGYSAGDWDTGVPTADYARKWTHVAVTYDGTDVAMFLDGKSIGSATRSLNTSSSTFFIGGSEHTSGGENFRGLISNLRLSDTVLYTENFTPPTEPLTSTANTKLLCCQSNASAGAAAVSPNVSGVNDGTVWSDFTSTSGGFSGSYPKTNLFDGQAPADANRAEASSNNVPIDITFNPPITVSSTVSIWSGKSSTQYQINNSGSYTTYSDAVGSYKDISHSGSLSNIKILHGDAANNAAGLSAIKIDGTQLKDPVLVIGDSALASNFNPFYKDIKTVRGNDTGYCTLNPLKKGSHITSLDHGNLQFESTGSSQYAQIFGTLSANSGKWYYEAKELSGGGIAYGWGLEYAGQSDSELNDEPGGTSGTWVYLSSGYKYNNSNIVAYGKPSTIGDIIGVAFDADNGELSFYKNGVYMGVAFTLATGKYYTPVTGDPNGSTNCSGEINFGQRPFRFPPPDGFQPLNIANLPITTPIDVILDQEYNSSATYSGKTTATTPSGNGSVRSNDGMGKGKWYAECVWNSGSGGSVIGIVQALHSSSNNLGQGSYGYGYYSGGSFQNNGSDSGSPASYSIGDVIGVAYDGDNGTLTLYKNGVSQGQAFSGLTSYSYHFAVSDGSSGATGNFTWRFKESEFTQSIPSNYSAFDQNRYTEFIQHPNEYVGITTWSGGHAHGSGGGTRQIDTGHQPDLVWIKQRNQAYSTGHQLYDSVRGAGEEKEKNPSSTAAQGAGNIEQYGWLNAFNSTGFEVKGGSVGYDYVDLNGVDYVAWHWKAGGNSNTFNIDGVGYASAADAGLDSGTVTPNKASVGTKNGFSIVELTTHPSASTYSFAHGLGAKPSFVIASQYEVTGHWYCWHQSFANNNSYILFNYTNAVNNSGTAWASTDMNSTLISDNASGHWGNSQKMIYWIWTDVPGLQKFGSYTGNNSINGPFIELGFRPALVLLKRYDGGAGDWIIKDSTRYPINREDDGQTLVVNVNNAEDGYYNPNQVMVDLLSSGFKIRQSGGPLNDSGSLYIYAAWAEAPSMELFNTKIGR